MSARCLLTRIVLGAVLFACQGTAQADPERLSAVLTDPEIQAKLKSLVVGHDSLVTSGSVETTTSTISRTQHSMIILEPSRDVDYSMVKVAPDRRMDYQITIVDPTSRRNEDAGVGLPGPRAPSVIEAPGVQRLTKP